MVLKKELALYERDESGELIPQETKLSMSKQDATDYPEMLEETVMIVPMPRGVLKKMFGLQGKVTDKKPDTDRDEDAEIIIQYCKNPEFTAEELKFAKPVIIRSIVKTILAESGVKLDDTAGTKKIDEETDEFGKNS